MSKPTAQKADAEKAGKWTQEGIKWTVKKLKGFNVHIDDQTVQDAAEIIEQLQSEKVSSKESPELSKMGNSSIVNGILSVEKASIKIGSENGEYGAVA